MNFTDEQIKVIKDRGHNILVSAAAGSGKTAVLVERILGRVADRNERCDIDRIIIMTFTRAAADEMKLRLSRRLAELVAAAAEDEDESYRTHLRRQSMLLRGAYINTIDGICSRLLHDNYNLTDLDPSFRVGNEGELKLLQKEVMEELLEREYEAGEQSFTDLVEAVCTGKTDDALEEAIERLYTFSGSKPDPALWLESCIEPYEVCDPDEFFDLPQVKKYYAEAGNILKNAVKNANEALSLCESADGPFVYEDVIREEMEAFEAVLQKWEEGADFSEMREALIGIEFSRLPSVKKDMAVNEDKKNLVSDLRKKYKEAREKLLKEYYDRDPVMMMSDINACAPRIRELVRLVRRFSDDYAGAKRDRNLLDFADLEHLVLGILYKKDENGFLTDDISAVAETYRDHFIEIYVDEYQDSNEVQEKFLKALAKREPQRGNLFMVGDVKQSIYKFRLATPALFIEKSKTYEYGEDMDDDSYRNRIIGLHKNFRSRSQVIDIVNFIFEKIMIEDVGGVEYDEEAALVQGAQFPEMDKNAECYDTDAYKAELLLLPPDETMDKVELEANSIALRIKELMTNLKVKDDSSNVLRNVKFSDIVILLRSTRGYDSVFRKVLEKHDIPVHVELKDGYFSGYEIRTVLDWLSVVDNLKNDEKLCSVLKGYFGGCTDGELARIRGAYPEGSFSDAVLKYAEFTGFVTDVFKNTTTDMGDGNESYETFVQTVKNPENRLITPEINAKNADFSLKFKLQKILEKIEKYANMSAFCSVREIIEALLEEDDFILSVMAMESGSVRCDNLRMLVQHAAEYEKTSFKGLFNFIKYIELLKKYEIDYGQSNSVSENDDAVRIMTIHKSKGLEFPVCIVAGLGKQFNLMDTKARILMDSDMGIGLEYINTDKRTRKTPVIKKAVAEHMKRESLGEELRIFYVALTRAKEKLIMSASLSKNNWKYLNDRLLVSTDINALNEDGRLSSNAISEGRSVADWMLPVLCNDPKFIKQCRSMNLSELSFDELQAESEVLSVSFINSQTLINRQLDVNVSIFERRESLLESLDTAREDTDRNGLEPGYDNIFNEIIGHAHGNAKAEETDVFVPLKASVSALKHLAMEENEALKLVYDEQDSYVNQDNGRSVNVNENYVNQNANIDKPLPSFIKREMGIDDSDTPLIGSLRGTAYHRFFELINYGGDLTEEGIRKQIEDFTARGFLTKDQARVLSVPVFTAFVSSDIGQRMKYAYLNGNLKREQPFCIMVPADTVDESYPHDKEILIQGIIDALFWEDGEYVIVDYKTDAVKKPQDLVNLYATQLDYYSRAIEQITGKKVGAKIIYSTKLGCEVSV